MAESESGSSAPVALITGGAGGLGRAAAEALIEAGYRVAVADLDSDRTTSTARSLGSEAMGIQCDVTDEAAIPRSVDLTVREFGRLDVLVNTAGTIDPSPSHMTPTGGWSRLIDVHLGGTMRMCQAAFPHLTRSPFPSIVNISSITAQRGFPARASYNSAKAAIEALTRTLAVEWAVVGIRVNAIAPGFILTPLAEEAYRTGLADRTERERLVPLGRMGRPDEVAQAIRWLATPDSSYVTGQVLAVDGGYLADGRTGPDPNVWQADRLRAYRPEAGGTP